jgi:hypothetical protein
MNTILLETKYAEYTPHLQDGYDAIASGDHSMPVSYWPPHMFHGDSVEDDWDEWENKQFMIKYAESSSFWIRILTLALRIEKLKKLRLRDPTYRNKSDNNIRKLRCVRYA